MTKLLAWIVGILCFLASVSGVISFLLSEKRDPSAFFENFFLNASAEFLGIAVGIGIPVLLASRKFNVLARPLIELIAQLRIEGKISGQSARNCVICAVKFINEDELKKDISLSIRSRTDTCDVCSLDIETDARKKCQHCGLSDHVWRLPKQTKTAVLANQ